MASESRLQSLRRVSYHFSKLPSQHMSNAALKLFSLAIIVAVVCAIMFKQVAWADSIVPGKWGASENNWTATNKTMTH